MARLAAASISRCALAACLAAVCLVPGHQARAQDAGSEGTSGFDNAQDYPIPSTAQESYSPIREGFTTPIDPRDALRGPKPHVDERSATLKAARQDEAPFFRDTEIKLNNRSYWLAEDSFGLSKPEALTSGGWISYQSGYLADFLKLSGTVYTSQPLYAPADAGETLNLTKDGDQITTLGQANVGIKVLGQEITAGRELVRTPYINPNDSRMIPLTFEGIVLLPAAGDDPHLDYIASYLWRYKPRDTAEFVPFTEPLGVTEDEGVLINGAHYRGTNFNVGLVNYWIKDAMNTAYGEVDYTLPIGDPSHDGPTLRVSLNDIDQRSVGRRADAGLSLRHVPGFRSPHRELSRLRAHGSVVAGRNRCCHSEALWLESGLHRDDDLILSTRRRAQALSRALLRFFAHWPERARILRGLRPGHRCHHSGRRRASRSQRDRSPSRI